MSQCELTTQRTSEASTSIISRTRNFVTMNLIQGTVVSSEGESWSYIVATALPHCVVSSVEYSGFICWRHEQSKGRRAHERLIVVRSPEYIGSIASGYMND